MLWQPPPSSPQVQPLCGRLPLRSGRSKHVPAAAASILSGFLPPFAKVRQQVSCTQILSSNPKSRPRFLSFCAIQRWPRRVCEGHAWVQGWVVSVAQWPASSRGALGSRGPGCPASFPGRCAVLPARGWADMRAGWHRTLLWAAVATGAHSIRTCRRTLSITEATM